MASIGYTYLELFVGWFAGVGQTPSSAPGPRGRFHETQSKGGPARRARKWQPHWILDTVGKGGAMQS